MADSALLIAYILGPVAASAGELARALGLPVSSGVSVVVSETEPAAGRAEDAALPVPAQAVKTTRGATVPAAPAVALSNRGAAQLRAGVLSTTVRSSAAGASPIIRVRALAPPAPLRAESPLQLEPSPNLSRERERGQAASGPEVERGERAASIPEIERGERAASIPEIERAASFFQRDRAARESAGERLATPPHPVVGGPPLRLRTRAAAPPQETAASSGREPQALFPEESLPVASSRRPAPPAIAHPVPSAFAAAEPALASPAAPVAASATGGGLDPQQLEDALVEVLLATARRHGLEV